MHLSTSTCSFQGSVSKMSPYTFNSFPLKVDPYLSFFLLSLRHVSRLLFGHCLHLGWLNSLLKSLNPEIWGCFFVSTAWNCNVMLPLIESVHILYQLFHIVSWLIHHTFAVLIYFLEVWKSHLWALYRRVNVKLHCMTHHCQFNIP